MKEWVLGIWLGIQAGYDFKHKEISVRTCILIAIFGIGFCIIENRSAESVFLALLPGMCSLVISKITGEIIGYGDGMVLMTMALFLSVDHEISILMTAFIIAGIAALVLLVVLKKRGSYRIPFIPFLFLAFVIDSIMKMGGM